MNAMPIVPHRLAEHSANPGPFSHYHGVIPVDDNPELTAGPFND